MKQCCLLIIACMAAYGSNAQQLHGRVADAQTKEALPGVSVRLLHESAGCNTNAQGKYELPATVTDSIEISYMGYISRQITAKDAEKMPVIFLQGDPRVTLVGRHFVGHDHLDDGNWKTGLHVPAM